MRIQDEKHNRAEQNQEPGRRGGYGKELGGVESRGNRTGLPEPKQGSDIKRYVLIGCGALLLNLMYVLVTVPYGIINGGVTSLSMILSRLPLTDLLPVNAWVTIVTGLLLLLCRLFLGRDNFIGSIFSCVCGVAGFNLFTIAVPDSLMKLLRRLGELGDFGSFAKAGASQQPLPDGGAQFLQELHTEGAGSILQALYHGGAGQLLQSVLDAIPPAGTLIELVLAAIGVGIGYWVCISNNATAVGMDTIALILHRKNERIPVAYALYAINIIVLLLGLATYGLVCVLMGIAFAGVQAVSLNALLKSGGGRQALQDGLRQQEI